MKVCLDVKQLQQETKFITSNNLEVKWHHIGLKLGERFLGGGPLGHLQSVELHCLGQRSAMKNISMYVSWKIVLISPALADSDNISGLDVSEAWRKMNRHVFVPLLKSVIFLDVVEVISPHHDGSVHLHLGNDSSQDTSTDWDLTKIYFSIFPAFLVNIFQNPHPGCQIIGWKMNGQVH